MRILFLPSYFYPEIYSSAHLDNELYESFAASGINMIAYVPTPSRGVSKEKTRIYLAKKKELLFNNSFELNRFHMFRESTRTLTRALRYTFSILIQFFKGLLTPNVDVIFLVSTPPIIGIVGGVLHKIKKIPFIYVVQDIFPDSLVNTGLAKKGSFFWKIGNLIEKFTYKNASKIIVISQDFKNNLIKKNVPDEKIEVIYNWIDTSKMIPILPEKNPLFSLWGLDPSHFYVVYAGNFGNAQNLESIIKAAQYLKEFPEIHFLLIGGGSQEDSLKKLVKDYKLQNLIFFPMQPAEMLPYVYSLGNLGIVSCKKGMGGNAFPSKTWSYLATSTPIVASYDLNSELSEMVKLNNLGVAIPPDRPEKMAQTIIELKENKKVLKEMSKNARAFVEDRASKNKSLNRYLEVVQTVRNNHCE